MKIFMEFKSTAKQHNNWEDEKEIDIPEGSTVLDALLLFGIETGDSSLLVVDEVMAKEEDVLKEGARVIIFPKGFGG